MRQVKPLPKKKVCSLSFITLSASVLTLVACTSASPVSNTHLSPAAQQLTTRPANNPAKAALARAFSQYRLHNVEQEDCIDGFTPAELSALNSSFNSEMQVNKILSQQTTGQAEHIYNWMPFAGASIYSSPLDIIYSDSTPYDSDKHSWICIPTTKSIYQPEDLILAQETEPNPYDFINSNYLPSVDLSGELWFARLYKLIEEFPDRNTRKVHYVQFIKYAFNCATIPSYILTYSGCRVEHMDGSPLTETEVLNFSCASEVQPALSASHAAFSPARPNRPADGRKDTNTIHVAAEGPWTLKIDGRNPVFRSGNGPTEIVWDGAWLNGNVLADGEYTLRLIRANQEDATVKVLIDTKPPRFEDHQLSGLTSEEGGGRFQVTVAEDGGAAIKPDSLSLRLDQQQVPAEFLEWGGNHAQATLSHEQAMALNLPEGASHEILWGAEDEAGNLGEGRKRINLGLQVSMQLERGTYGLAQAEPGEEEGLKVVRPLLLDQSVFVTRGGENAEGPLVYGFAVGHTLVDNFGQRVLPGPPIWYRYNAPDQRTTWNAWQAFPTRPAVAGRYTWKAFVGPFLRKTFQFQVNTLTQQDWLSGLTNPEIRKQHHVLWGSQGSNHRWSLVIGPTGMFPWFSDTEEVKLNSTGAHQVINSVYTGPVMPALQNVARWENTKEIVKRNGGAQVRYEGSYLGRQIRVNCFRRRPSQGNTNSTPIIESIADAYVLP